MGPRLAALLVFSSLFAAGCQSTPPPRVYSPSDERPKVTEDARWWERKGTRELERANETIVIEIKCRHLDTAISYLRTSRDLYYEELLALERQADAAHPIPVARREALETEIDRIQGEIDRIFKDRPVGYY